MKRRPKIFYKYCSPARIDILINGRIRFTQRDDLNDIHDMRPVKAFNEAGHLAERQKMAIRYPQMHNMPPITPEEFGQTIEKTLDEALVLCLSAKWDLVPMWSYYAESHQGFAIGFDASHEYFSGTKHVEYTKQFPVLEDDFHSVFQKSPQWRSEREWRLLRVLEADAPVETRGRVHLYEFPANAVREVVLGVRINQCLKCQLRQIMRTEAYSHVKVFQSVRHQGKWGLARE